MRSQSPPPPPPHLTIFRDHCMCPHVNHVNPVSSYVSTCESHANHMSSHVTDMYSFDNKLKIGKRGVMIFTRK